MKITVDDARRAGFCVPAMRAWAQENDQDFKSLIRDGIDSEVLIATGNRGIVDLVLKARGE